MPTKEITVVKAHKVKELKKAIGVTTSEFPKTSPELSNKPFEMPNFASTKPQPTNQILRLVGKEIVFVQRNGLRVIGTVCAYRDGLINLKDAKVIDNQGELATDWILIDRTALAYIYPVAKDQVQG